MWSHIIATMLFSWVEIHLKKGNFFIFWRFSRGLSKHKLSFIIHKFTSICQKLKSNGSFGNQKSISIQLCPHLLTLSASSWVELWSKMDNLNIIPDLNADQWGQTISSTLCLFIPITVMCCQAHYKHNPGASGLHIKCFTALRWQNRSSNAQAEF